MTDKLSRQKLATYIADQLKAGDSDALNQLAAYLVETGRTDEADRIVLSAQELLERDGYVYAEVTTATKLSADMKTKVADLLQATDIEIKETIDPDVLGGIRVKTPSRLFDATIARRLQNLRESKV